MPKGTEKETFIPGVGNAKVLKVVNSVYMHRKIEEGTLSIFVA